MAHIWSRSIERGWWRYLLEGGVFSFDVFDELNNVLPRVASSRAEKKVLPAQCEGPEQELAAAVCGGRTSGVVTRSVEIDGSQRWVLLSTPDARVRRNGTEVLLGLAVLRDRDEIMLPGIGANDRFYFSAEQLAEVVPAPANPPTGCPRCKTEIAEGSPAVRCPACGAWHHQREDRPCWNYTDRCGACHQQETSLDGQLQWSPEEL